MRMWEGGKTGEMGYIEILDYIPAAKVVLCCIPSCPFYHVTFHRFTTGLMSLRNSIDSSMNDPFEDGYESRSHCLC